MQINMKYNTIENIIIKCNLFQDELLRQNMILNANMAMQQQHEQQQNQQQQQQQQHQPK